MDRETNDVLKRDADSVNPGEVMVEKGAMPGVSSNRADEVALCRSFP